MPIYCLDLEDGDMKTLRDVCGVLSSRGYPTNFFSSLLEGNSIDPWGNTRSVYIITEKPIDIATLDQVRDIESVGDLRFGASETHIVTEEGFRAICAALQPY
jgi:hypothetical protein